ncbi:MULTISPECIES: hypothetical protein [Hyphomonas]|uniref:hypothetical protein n=1 Tax=Hyphomonas TaxID=85 RepID=UPI0035156E9B
MKVRYTLPVRGILRLSETGEIQYPDMTFRFKSDEPSGFVTALELEIINIPQENWPTLIPVEQDPEASIPRFPFDVNPKAVRFSQYLPHILNLESLLSLAGLESIDFAMVREEWIPEPDDEKIGIWAGIERKPSEREPDADPVSDLTLAKFIAASAGEETETGGLAHFRVAADFFYQERYIDSIRYSYLAVEYLFAGGKHKKTQTLKALNAASDLIDSIEKSFKHPQVQSAAKRLQEQYSALATSLEPPAVIEWAFDLRGSIQHGNPSSPKRWHPSRQERHQDEALLLLNIAHEACWIIAQRRLSHVKPIEPSDID